MEEFVPHPLVTRVGLDLAEKKVVTIPDDVDDPTVALKPPERPPATKRRKAGTEPPKPEPPVPDLIGDDSERPVEKNVLATAFANQANVPALSLFAGFLGAQLDRDGEKWRLLYLDSRLSSWLLVREADIVVHERLKDLSAPSGMRDILWVDGAAMVKHGSGAVLNESRFLVGEFTRAGDYAASTGGGTFSAATGLLCEATTPGCCFGNRTRR